MKKGVGCYAGLALVLGLLGGFVWLTHHPETPWLEEAEGWPLVGVLAQSFRETYLPLQPAEPEPPAVAAKEEAASEPGLEPRRRRPRRAEQSGEVIHIAPPSTDSRRLTGPVPGVMQPGEGERRLARLPHSKDPSRVPSFTPPQAKLSPYTAKSREWFLPGIPLRDAVDPQAKVRLRLPAMAYLPVLESDGGWRKVVYRGEPGWIDTSWEPPFNRRKARRGIVRHRSERVRGSDWEKLRKAKRILGIERPVGSLGAYELFTDVEDRELLDFLDRAARLAEDAYFARYGRLPSGDPRRSVVLFATEEQYRLYSEGENVASASHVGHAGSGVVVFYAEGAPRERLASTLIHEITHLLNTRALTGYLPPWLQEGMATDLGGVWVEETVADRERPARDRPWVFAFLGLEARMLQLGPLLQAGKLPSMAGVIGLDRATFYREGIGSYAYAQSAAFIRYLMVGEEGRHAEDFRAFLQRIAAGQRADPRTLLALLDAEVGEVDAGFQAWLGGEIEAAQSRMLARFETIAR